jgi:cysteine desulfurase family protein (TIGR01976 family)
LNNDPTELAEDRFFAIASLSSKLFCYSEVMSLAVASTEVRSSAAMMPTEEIRECFPALARTHNGYPVAYFDGPGGTQVPTSVVKAMTDYLYHHNANTHWNYPTSEETDGLIDRARNVLAGFFNATASEIVFGANMTTLTFHLARAIGRNYEPNDDIVVTELDHHGNVAPWQALEKERGVKARMVKMIPETGELDWEDFSRQLTSRTKLVAIGAASNALGTINDVRRAGEMAHSLGAKIFVDAVHYAPHESIDVREWGCDFLTCSAYKFYGPHIGILYGRHDLLASLDFPRLIPAPDTPPERAETGTQNHEGIAGAAAAVEFLASLAPGRTMRESLGTGFQQLRQRGAALTKQLWDGLSELDGIHLFGPAPDKTRTPTVAFTVDAWSSTEVARKLAERGLFLSHGDFYAATVIERLGQSSGGLVRAGSACYTTATEIDRLLAAVRELC